MLALKGWNAKFGGKNVGLGVGGILGLKDGMLGFRGGMLDSRGGMLGQGGRMRGARVECWD